MEREELEAGTGAAAAAPDQVIRDVFGEDDSEDEAPAPAPAAAAEGEGDEAADEGDEGADVLATARSKKPASASMRDKLQMMAKGKKKEGEGARSCRASPALKAASLTPAASQRRRSRSER